MKIVEYATNTVDFASTLKACLVNKENIIEDVSRGHFEVYRQNRMHLNQDPRECLQQ